jgi:predicted ester cyclase
MGIQENKEFVRRYFEALSGNPKPAELVDQYVAEQLLKDHIAGAEAGFPKYEMLVEQMIAEGDLVSVIARARGTHTGTFMGIPPTGKSFDVPLHITYRIEDGKIVDHWMLMDNAGIMQQLGLVPSSSEAA